MDLEGLKRKSTYIPQDNTTSVERHKKCGGFSRIVSKDSVGEIPMIGLQTAKETNITDLKPMNQADLDVLKLLNPGKK